MALKNNTWKLNQWYDQSVAGNVSYSGTKELWTWGRASSGMLGQNQPANTNYSSPAQIPGTTWTTPIIAVGGGGSNGVRAALKTDGTLWSWGYNNHGGLGQNNKTYYSSPVQIPGTTWAGGAVGKSCQYQVKTDGTLWTWGQGTGGKLLQDSQTSYSSPRQVPGTTWSGAFGKISAGANDQVSLIKTDGTLWVGGKNDDGGEVGDGTTTSRSSPVQIPGSWSRVARGSSFGFAINSDGELYAWGRNASGNLGLNNTTHYSGPQQVGSDTTWTDISCTNGASFGIKTDGTLWAWGNGNYGALGLNQGHSTRISSPTQIPGTTWSELARGGVTNMGAIKTDGTFWVWGQDEYGNLGENTPDTDKSSPVQLPGTTWHQVTGTNNGFFTIKEL